VPQTPPKPFRHRVGVIAIGAMIASVIALNPVIALKYAKPEHSLKADPSIPVWVPGPLVTEPEEEFNIVGADVMDEMTLGWAKMMRKAHPCLGVTVEARASCSGGPAFDRWHGARGPGRSRVAARRGRGVRQEVR